VHPDTRTPLAVAVLAWGLCGLFCVFSLGTAVLYLSGSGDADQLLTGLALGFPVVGALVAVREPANAVGWLLLLIGVAFGFQGFVDAYVMAPDRPFAVAAAWVSNWIWNVWLYVAAAILPLLFPNGRLVTPRWRIALWIAAAALTCTLFVEMFSPGRLDVESPVPLSNPVALELPATLWSVLGLAGNVLVCLGFLLGAASLVVRRRRSYGRQRLQVTLFVYVASLALCCLLLAMVEVFASENGSAGSPAWTQAIGAVGWMGGLLLIVIGIPYAVGTAILRHQLYDIDLVVKRTVVYATLTIALAGVYLVSVLSLRLLLDPLTGTSDLAVAASTLAVAGLFRPVRRQIQQTVDRRFNRHKYDPTATVESFAGRLQHEVDLETVKADLETIVSSTVQPTRVTLWLRERP
jgi:hypothetical protein